MHKIYKYRLEAVEKQTIHLPADAKILTVAQQVEVPCIWALVNPAAELVARQFVTVGTGHDIDSDYLESLEYIGTFQLSGGALVFHLFEEARF